MGPQSKVDLVFRDFSRISGKYRAEKKSLQELSHKAVLDWTCDI